MSYLNNTSRLLSMRNLICLCHRRYKHKRNKHSSRVAKSGTHHALDYFDKFHKPIYGELWPSIRVALLSQRKYCALLNNFADPEDAAIDLLGESADDILQTARDRIKALKDESADSPPTIPIDACHNASDVFTDVEDRALNANRDASSLHDFMPVRRVGSESEQLKLQELQQSMQQSSGFECDVVANDRLHFPLHLRAYAVERGEIQLFEKPEIHQETKKLNYYPMDAGSLLPVVALDLYPDCRVLDLCAAPGGKTLAMLQTLLPGEMTCVDNSLSRVRRLNQVLQQYIPDRYVTDGNVEVVKTDGVAFCHGLRAGDRYDRVLVDAPCYTDRHYLFEDDGNLFQPSKLKTRLSIPYQQQMLLFSGLHACRPGGHVVYSTCTLAPAQNEAVVRATLEKVWQETDMEFVVKDTRDIREAFGHVFAFYDQCRLGTLVLPHLTANFGPTYFCKLERLR